MIIILKINGTSKIKKEIKKGTVATNLHPPRVEKKGSGDNDNYNSHPWGVNVKQEVLQILFIIKLIHYIDDGEIYEY